MTGIFLPIQGIPADIVLGEDWKTRRDAMARSIDARLLKHWAIDLSGWPTDGATWPTLNVSGFGGPVVDENGVTAIAAAWGPIALTDDDVNFIERTHAGVVSATLGGFTPDALGMYEITTVGGEITAILDHRVQASVPLLAAALLELRALATAADGVPMYDGAGSASLLTVDVDGTLAGNSDTRLATQKAVKTYADAIIAANDAMVFMGVIDCSADPNYPAADRGDTYRVSVAGKIGGASGPNVEAGDLLVCLTDGTASGTHAAVGAQWTIAQTNLDGAVIGPASVTDGHAALFDGTTGKLIKTAGFAPANAVHTHPVADLSDASANGKSLISAADYEAMRTLLGVAAYQIPLVIDGSTGRKADFPIEIPGTIVAIRALGDGSGSLELDLWRTTYTLYDNSAHPVVGDSICAGNEFTITAAHKGQDVTLAGWDPALAVGDILTPVINSISGFSRVTFSILVLRA